jgi:hypothetical protein
MRWKDYLWPSGQPPFSNVKVIEASDVLRSFMRRSDENLSALEFAQHILREQGPDAIARRMIRMYRLNDVRDFIITGFRTIEELETIRSLRPDSKVVLIESSDRARYARYLERGRGSTFAFKEFLEHDVAQWAFGLLRVAEDLADIKIINESTLPDYNTQVAAVLTDPDSPVAPNVSVNIRPRYHLDVHRVFRCLWLLAENGQAMTCDQIEKLTAGRRLDTPAKIGGSRSQRYTGKPITHNNVNKILKAVPELAERIEEGATRVRYRITDVGRAYIRLMCLNAKRDQPAR